MTDELDDGIPDDRIAIVGAALRVPGADDLDAFWDGLLAGVDAVRTFDDSQLAAAGVPERLRRDPRYVPAAGRVAGLDGFDADLFGEEAAALDPQQRLFLEVAWAALEHAGHGRGGPVGVFAGAAPSRHLVDLVRTAVAEDAPEERFAALLSHAAPDHVPLRVSHKLGLTGPSVAVQATCASSLVAVCTAAQSLADYRCDVAIAGGVSVASPAGYLADGGLRSPDGRCRVFDADAAGSAPASGAGAVVLRRLADAVADGDPVLAVVGGWAVTNDGAGRAGYAVPTPAGQAAALAEALAASDVEPRTVGFVEAHGSGTPLGDAVEVAALTSVYGVGRAARSCLLGAVRANLGDLDAAAGVVGLIKAALAVRTGRVPPTPHFRRPHPETGLDGGPFLVNTAVAPWPVTGSPRRAGVSSIGQGGTNAHVILEEPPPLAAPPPDRGPVLLALSAASPAALDRVAARLRDHLARHPELRITDVAHTLAAGRRPLRHRAAVVVADRADALAALAAGSGRLLRGEEPDAPTALDHAARQWLRGNDLEPATATGGVRATRVVLPGYPFARALSTGGPPAV